MKNQSLRIPIRLRKVIVFESEIPRSVKGMNAELTLVRSYVQARSALPLPAAGTREIEARWKVSTAQYYQTLKAVRGLPGASQMRTTYIEDQFHGEIRHRQVFDIEYEAANIMNMGEEPVLDQWIRKQSVGTPYDSIGFGFRVAVANEIPVPPSTKPKTFERRSTRHEVTVSPRVRIDFPHDENPDRGQTGYRVEVELLDNTAVEEFAQWVSRITGFIQESEIPIPSSEAQEVIAAFNLMVAGVANRSDAFQRRTLPHPEDLTMHDLLNGSLMARGRTSATAKADGDVSELLFLDKGVYAVSGRDQINKIAALRIANIIPAMFQGEMVIPKASAKIKSKYTFVLFETLFVKGVAIREIPSLLTRREHQTALVTGFVNRPDLTILQKAFPVASNADEFYAAANQVLDSLPGLSFHNDGLVETEVDRPYLEGEIRIKKSKSRRDLTIDFKIGEHQLIVVDDARKFAEVPFTGSTTNPLQMTAEEFEEFFNNTEFMTLGAIWEFEFDEQLRPHPRRPRYRKSGPNKMSTARNVWELINRPVREETLRGTDMELMKRYHNAAKTELYSTLKDGSTYADYGSGKGGDVNKWKKKRLQVYLLEPDLDNRVELQRRLKENDFERNVRGLVNFGAEETERVEQELLKGVQVDAVGMMLSWTFFNESSEKMDAALETIDRSLKPGGVLLMTTVDGDAMVEGMRGASLLETPQYSIERRQGREILIDIGGSIVQDQIEWLPDLVELDVRLKERGFRLLEKKRLNQNPWLPKQQRILSAMYVTLRYQKMVEEQEPEEQEAEEQEAEEQEAEEQEEPTNELEAVEEEEQTEEASEQGERPYRGIDPTNIFEKL